MGHVGIRRGQEIGPIAPCREIGDQNGETVKPFSQRAHLLLLPAAVVGMIIIPPSTSTQRRGPWGSGSDCPVQVKACRSGYPGMQIPPASINPRPPLRNGKVSAAPSPALTALRLPSTHAPAQCDSHYRIARHKAALPWGPRGQRTVGESRVGDNHSRFCATRPASISVSQAIKPTPHRHHHGSNQVISHENGPKTASPVVTPQPFDSGLL
ncbi:hypothetical protein QBC34DRAFT_176619 [Podospora aff. communis PSN243]|uniref:Uncharacterized protein n=1 Tax=Podospora aff. communis PSN243 TaxID=3040156 RepID=A0AAV9GZW8_9PEZI|nr:hypothetical protein QBC34DRAFT_176619 [Podospora aff. communis PSN243]